jgi:metal-sulfur cluster biosynthetic enzyme
MELTRENVLQALRPIEDPEIHLSIVDLGLIYDVEVEDERVAVKMTLTSPMCPVGPAIIQQVKDKVQSLEGVKSAAVDLVWDPQWDPRTMATDEVKDKLGLW